MNKENILKVADAIENATLPIGFNMSEYRNDDPVQRHFHDHTGHNCGTVACIAGWAAFMVEGWEFGTDRPISRVAADFLGLDDYDAHLLFSPILSVRYNTITPEQAVEVLHHLAETGEIDWSVAITEELIAAAEEVF